MQTVKFTSAAQAILLWDNLKDRSDLLASGATSSHFRATSTFLVCRTIDHKCHLHGVSRLRTSLELKLDDNARIQILEDAR